MSLFQLFEPPLHGPPYASHVICPGCGAFVPNVASACNAHVCQRQIIREEIERAKKEGE